MSVLNRKFVRFAGAAMALSMGSQLAAEVLPVSGVYGARVELPPEVKVIATENFGGDLGPDVSIDIADILGRVTIEGEIYFRILPATVGGGDRVIIVNTSDDANAGVDAARALADDPNSPDAVMRGSVRSEVTERRVEPKKVSECVARNEKDNCIERRDRKVPCRELRVRVDPRLLLLAPDGEQLYSQSGALTDAKRFCRDEDYLPSANEMIDGLVGELVSGIRLDLAPIYRAREVRVLESRKGLAKSDRRAFKDAVRMTKNDVLGSCLAFEALEANNPSHVSVLFNIGLCKEGEGELQVARDYYERVLVVQPDKVEPREGIFRLNSRERGEAQMATRYN